VALQPRFERWITHDDPPDLPHLPRREVAMTNAQIWALVSILGVLATGIVTVVTVLIAGVRSEIAGVRGEMHGLRNEMSARFDYFDRDLQAVIDRVFRRDEG
jgi:hypothetical protein